MGKFLPLSIGLMMLSGAAAWSAAPGQEAVGRYLQERKAPLAMMQKAKAGSPLTLGNDKSSTVRKAVGARPVYSHTGLDELGYLDGPDGTTWFFTAKYDYEEVVYEYYTERLLQGFEITVYDSTHKLVGTVKDKIELGEGDTRVASIGFDAMVSKSFFNNDDRYELIVNVAMNRPDYSVRCFSQIYSIGAPAGEDGDTPVVTTMPGYVCASVNTANRSWEENFYIGVITETGYDDTLIDNLSEYAASNKNVITVYKKAGWSANGPVEIGRFEVSGANLPGDQMAVPFFMADVRDGKPVFVFQHYEKWFFKNAIGPGLGLPDENEEDGMPFLDNNLVVEIYTYPGSGNSLVEEKIVKIPADQSTDNPDVMFRYYSVGHLLYAGDMDAEGNTNVCIQQYLRSNDDMYLTSFVRYDAAGSKIRDLATDTEYYTLMSDIRGFESQLMYAKSDDAGAFTFHFVDVPSGMEITEIPAAFQNYQLRANVDRYPVGESYEYAFQTAQSHYDEENNVLEHIVWVNADGDYSHTDVLNLGNDINMAQVYITCEALSPYVFNTDEAREYMWLVKRTKPGSGASSSAADTWLYILSSDGSKLFEVGPDSEKGEIRGVSLVSPRSNGLLWITYSQDETRQWSEDLYSLPMGMFARGGEGTVENPYLISTAGDFEQMRLFPDKHFALAADIVADGTEFSSIKSAFTGSLDGRGHKITGLTVTGNGIFAELQTDAVVKDITFVGSRLLNPSGTSVAFVAARASGATISGVHIAGLSVEAAESDFVFGAIAGTAALGTTIEHCSLSSSTLVLPEAEGVGGIAGNLRTGATIEGCSVKARITAGAELGGIAGSIYSDNNISDCHVDADLTAGSVVGGIVGYNDGSPVMRCYVEGSIKATGQLRAMYYDNGPCAGGVVGTLENAFVSSESGESSMQKEPIIANNFVRLTSLEGYTPALAPSHSEQQKTLHRIVGRSQVNEAPEIIDYTSDYKPVYGEPLPAEPRLKSNFVISGLDPVQSDIEALHTTTEGESVDADRLSAEWFAEKLGLEYADGKLWNELADYDPALKHETGNFCTPAELTVEEGSLFDVHVVFVDRENLGIAEIMDRFSYSATDESIAEMTGDATLTKGRLAVQFEALKAGTTVLDICGAKCTVKVVEATSGIGSVASPAQELKLVYDGAAVSAAEADIAIYNLAGTRVAGGRNRVSTLTLATGVYIATASDGVGSASLKFVVR
ncbi:MAG: T9SS type A sorting domain-containing protein [Muribaculaceae bacterium]|nr:T9SS type A sorting domain-containing protein [Muribaculaceae bacterium]